MVATDSAETAPTLWSELLFGLLGGGCQAQKTSLGCEVVNVVEAGSTIKKTAGSPVPAEILSEPEAESSPLGVSEAATRAASRDAEGSEVPASLEQQLTALKVFGSPPSGDGCGDSLGRQCCQKLCPAPGCAEPVPSPLQASSSSKQASTQVKRGPSGVRFCVLMRDGSGLLSSESHQQESALLPAFRECFSEAAAEAAGVSVSRLRVLDVGLPREVWARPNKAESEASGTPSGSTDTGAGVLRFLLEDLGESKALEEPEAEDKAMDMQLGKGRDLQKEASDAAQSHVRILAVIREQETDERSGSTIDSSGSVEEPGAMRALENFMQQVNDRGSKLHQSLAGWAGDEPLLACGEEERSPSGRINAKTISGRRWASRRERISHRPIAGV
mmetsp:Transcript_52145/g.93496  ORF Transcript_52145/g.93496 Transcript_52145/m.93496 type:complete len:388 (+) Transcript_52145:59-1222(+)